MLHARRQIVLAIVECLRRDVTGVTSVKAGRAAPMPVSEAPFLLVYARREDSREIATLDDDTPRLHRPLTLYIDIVHADPEDDDGAADALCLLVEKAMAGNPTLGGLAKSVELVRTDLDARAEGETRLGRARLEYAIEYHTSALRPELSLE